MSAQLQVTGEAKIRDLQGPVVANSGVITALDGAASQYVRGDGTLADFPSQTGGGSSVSYYLNGSVNQGTFGGSTYYQMSKNAITGAGTNFSTSSNGLLAQFITDANDPDQTSIPSGNWNIEFFMGVSASSGALASFYVEFYKYNGSTFTLIATNVATPEFLTGTTSVESYFTSVAFAETPLATTDRLAIRIYANVASKTVTLYTEDNRLCQVVTTFSRGILSLNNLTDQQQYFAVGTSGTDFNIVSSIDTHTFNIPTASATNRGLLSTTDWSTFNNKVPYTGATGSVDLGENTYIGGFVQANGTSVLSGTISLKQNGFIPAATGYATIGSVSAGKLSIYFGESGLKSVELQNDLLTASRTYDFPDLSGTLALLEGTQTFTGSKTFDSYALFNYSQLLKLNPTFDTTPASGYLGIRANQVGSVNSVSFWDGSTYNTAKLSFNNAASYTYTFPASSGTIALTSNLSSYVPYSGATTSVNLGNNGLTASQLSVSVPSGSSAGNLFYVNNVLRGSILSNDTYFQFASNSAGGFVFNNSAAQNILILQDNKVAVFYGSIINYGATNTTALGLTGSGGATQLTSNATSNKSIIVPNANGTLALTSDLLSYVPYSGATANVDLGAYGLINKFTSFTYNPIVAVIGSSKGIISLDENKFYISFAHTSNVNTHLFNFPTTDRTYTLPDASGTIALTSNIPSVSGTSGQVTYFNGTSSVTGSSNHFWDATNNRLGIGLTNPQRSLEIYSATADSHLRLSGSAPSVSMGEAITGSVYQAKFGLATAAGQYVSGAVAGDFVMLSQTGATIFATSATEKARLTSGGNFGIGTTSPSYLLDVNGTGRFIGAVNINYTTTTNAKLNVGGVIYSDNNAGNNFAINSSGTNYGFIQNDAADKWSLGTGTSLSTLGTPILTWTKGGNVGIGTSSPSYILSVHNTGGNDAFGFFSGGAGATLGGIKMGNAGTSYGTLHFDNSTNDVVLFQQYGSGSVRFGTNNTEKMRITSGGNVLIGTTSSNSYPLEIEAGAGGPQIYLKRSGANGQIFMGGSTGADTLLFIRANGSNGVYLPSGGIAWISASDESLKTDLVPIENATNKVSSLRAVIGRYKTDEIGIRRSFLIAQDVIKVLPEAVNKNQETGELGVAYTDIIPLLVAAIKEQQAQIEELKQLIKNK